MSSVPFASEHLIARDYGAYVDGTWVTQGTNPVTITAHVQAFTESDQDVNLANRLGAESVEGCIFIDSNDELYTAKKGDGFAADILTWQGQDYEIKSVANFPDVLPHWEAVGVLIDDNV
jgi:imidazolonepropionase-like amidohydrolase